MLNLLIFHTNDFHSKLDEEKVSRFLPKNKPFLLFDSGDAIYGSNTYFRINEPVLEKMNRLKFNAMAMGNREFHYLRSVVRRRAAVLQFPILAANLLDLTGNINGIVKPHIILNHNGIRIGVFGLTVAQYPENGWQENITRFRFIDYYKAATNAVTELCNNGAQFIIMLSHIGIKEDKVIAEKVQGLDLILGGHTHTILFSPVKINGTFIAQTGSHGNFLGKIELALKDNGERFKIDDIKGELLPIKQEFQDKIDIKNADKKLLFISNGHGEDAIATSIIREYLEIKENDVFAFPLVGEGDAYNKIGVNVVGPRKTMPSEGLSGWTNPVNCIKDLKQGLVNLFARQGKFLQDIRGNVSVVVAVGDILPVIMAQLFVKKSIVFIGTAKSDYVSGYYWWERIWLRNCAKVFTRDEETKNSLRLGNIPAYYEGNAMMDNLEPRGVDFGIKEDEIVITFLPGSRENAYNDFSIMLAAIERLSKEPLKFRFLTAIPGSLNIDRIKGVIPLQRWSEMSNMISHDNGVVGEYSLKERTDGGITLLLIKGYFADILSACRLVIGQAGTGNEQAAGLGKPVIAFDPLAGKELKWYRRRQKKLLGDAVSVVLNVPEIIAKEAMAIITDRDKEQVMIKTGKTRMGEPGASLRMAESIKELLNSAV